MNELSRRGKLLLKAFTELPHDERAKLIKLMQEYQGDLRKGLFSESLSKSLGPMDTGKCGCCGN